MISPDRAEELLGRFSGLRVALVGDLFLDRYLEIDPDLDEPSVETGLTAYQVTSARSQPGALGTVINNLHALGITQLRPVTVVGDDGAAYELRRALTRQGVDLAGMLTDSRRLTPTYTKPLRRQADGPRKELNRLDIRSRESLRADMQWRLEQALFQAMDWADGLIVLDQIVDEDQGIVNAALRDHLREVAAAFPQKLIFVDSRAFIDRFSAGILKTNQSECVSSESTEEPALDVLETAARKRCQRTDQPVYCTLGSRGMLVVPPEDASLHVPAQPAEGPLDIVGAGDSATSGIVTSLLAGASLEEAAAMGNLVASITVQQLGTTGTASPAQVLDRCRAWQNE